MQKRYPFKFLDAYTRADSDFFFGRNDEIDVLYQMVFLTDLLLVYGASGTGKTSLIQCGLASKFQSHDWLALNIRRGNNLNESLEKALDTAGRTDADKPAGTAGATDLDWVDEDLSADTASAEPLSPLARRFKTIYLRHFKPLYLIFDQFEELYILGNKAEQQQFMQTVRDILRVKQPVKIILSIREEYLGYLYEFERAVPELLRKKLRVEPMNLDKVKTVIQSVGSRSDSLVRLRIGEESALAEGIFEKIRGEDKTLHIPLPYLQVFLDKLYLHVTDDKTRQSEAEFDLQHLADIGDLGDVLRNFLDEQVRDMALKLPAAEEQVWQMLSPFVTLEGTKEPLSEAQLADKVPDAAPDLLRRALQAFVAHRILRFSEAAQLYEIAHDSLAKQIHAKRSDEEIALLEVQRLVRSQTAVKAEAREFFSEKQLLFVEPYLSKYRPSAEEEDWIRQSREHVRTQKEAVLERQRAELERVRAQAEQERQLRAEAENQTMLALQETARADSIAAQAQHAARRAYANDLAIKSQIALHDGDRTSAYRLAEFAYRYVDDDNLSVTRALMQALYYNDNTKPLRLPWASNLETGSTFNSVAFSPDGKRLATASSDTTTKIWDLGSGKVTLTLKGHTSSVWSVAFSPDGTRLATVSADNTAKVWDIDSGKEMLSITHDSPIWSIAFSPNGKHIATASDDMTAKIWDINSGDDICTLSGHTSSIWSVAFSPDGKSLATASDDMTSKIWDLNSGEEILSLKGHIGYVLSVVFSPDGSKIATASEDKTARIWDLNSGKEVLTLQQHDSPVRSVAFSPDGKYLATASNDKTARIWDLDSGKDKLTLRGHCASIWGVAFSPDGKTLATTSEDKTAKIWDLNFIEEALTLQGHKSDVRGVAFSPDGKMLATASDDKTAKIWDLDSRKTIIAFEGHIDYILQVAFSPDGKMLATASKDKTAKIWDLNSIKVVLKIQGHESGVRSVAFSPDGKYLATASDDKTAKIWSLDSGKEILSLNGHTDYVFNVVFSPDGKKVATASNDKTAKIWDLDSGKETFTVKEHDNPVLGLAFSPDGKYLATASLDNIAKVWDLDSRKEIHSLEEHTSEIFNVIFSSDSKKLLTASNDKTAKIWDLITGKASITLEGHTDSVWGIAFSPDGKRLATSSSDNTVKIWALTPDYAYPAVHWKAPYSTGTHQLPLAGLTLIQLVQYGLETLLDQKPGNEDQLIASSEVWQIASFADLYVRKIAKSLPQRADYERAQRLYAACLHSGVEEEYFRKRVEDLERIWKQRGN